MVFLVAAMILATASPTVALPRPTSEPTVMQELPDPYASDPLGLIAHYNLTSARGTSSDRFEVWICEGVRGELNLTPDNVAGFLNAELPAFFSWLSDGRYDLGFVTGGTVRANNEQDCMTAVGNRSVGGSHGAVVASTLHTQNAEEGLMSTGGTGRYFWRGNSSWWEEFYPENARRVWMGWFTHVGSMWSPVALTSIENGVGSLDNLHALSVLKTVAHEIGHTLSWPHSYTGMTERDNGTIDEYDNPMDMMSRGTVATYSDKDVTVTQPGVLTGTPAVNRYAAGWISPENVQVFTWSPLELYAVNPIGSEGAQMVAIPYSTAGVFESIGVRVAKGYDTLIPIEGVEIYRVDQRAEECENPFWDACWGLRRRTRPALVDETGENPVRHVLDVGDWIRWGESDNPDRYKVNVIERHGDTFVIEISYGNQSPVFTDVPFEDFFYVPVRWAQSWNITTGIGNGRFGIERSLTREEMVTFLCRMHETPEGCAAYDGSVAFSDVPAGHWSAGPIGWAVEHGITAGVGGGRFGLGETLTREQAVTFLHRAVVAFLYIEPGTSNLGSYLFDDVPDSPGAWYQEPIGWAGEHGITGGTADRTFGYGQPLSREETMLFMCRTAAPRICPQSGVPVPSTIK